MNLLNNQKVKRYDEIRKIFKWKVVLVDYDRSVDIDSIIFL